MTGKRDVYPMTFVSPQTISPGQNALRYSDMSKRNKESFLLSALKNVFPDVRGLSLARSSTSNRQGPIPSLHWCWLSWRLGNTRLSLADLVN